MRLLLYCCSACLVVILSLPACKKNQQSNPLQDELVSAWDQTTIKIGQEVILYDTTFLHDSLSFDAPPGSRLYKWSTSPDGEETFANQQYERGEAYLSFRLAGTYQISAAIYDSLGQHLIGHTNTLSIQVTSDTLQPAEPLQQNDTLIMHFTTSSIVGPAPFLSFSYQTAKAYPAGSTVDFRAAGGNFVFHDSARLSSYPFITSSGPAAAPIVSGTWQLGGMTPDTPFPLNIVWEGNSYSGSVTISNTGAISWSWPQGAAVRLQ
jgi:hypothetical protein